MLTSEPIRLILKRASGAAELGSDALPPQVFRAGELVLARKGQDPVVLDLRGISGATDFFLVASGESDTHVRAICEHVLETLEREGVAAAGVEGLAWGRWVLIDYIDFVVHVFHPALREYYQLERLWGDAPMLALSENSGDA